MEASADLSIITLVAHASAVVQIVLAILLIFSLVSWTIIFQKWFQMSRARRESRNFDKRFWGGASRAMRARYQRELDILESGLSVLATIGSVSPYIGLFGTVWGIMDAFTGLGNLESASLAVVAPGIAEALVATAIGLFAAIPAVIGYNRFAYSLDRLSSQYESFMQEFQNILGRQA